MEIVCIMGKALTSKQKIEQSLQNLGYHRLAKYRICGFDETDSQSEYKDLSFSEYTRLNNQKAVLKWIEFDNVKYGIPRPFGYLKYVMIATPDIVELLKEQYKNQVFVVYIDDQNTESDFLKSMKGVQKYISQPFQVKDDDCEKAKQLADIVVNDNENTKKLALKIVFMLNKLKRRGV